jgi:hypothetical protein
LAELLVNEIDLLGGEAAVTKAQECCEDLTDDERRALAGKSGKVDILRSACLKIARHLPLLSGIFLFGGPA